MQVEIRAERPEDRDAIRQVNQQAFAQDDEANLVDALRSAGYVRGSFVALVGGKVVGHILYSELKIVRQNDSLSALALAPMAVLPEYQRRGIGSQLVRESLKACRDAGHRIVIVLGHPEFYPRFGFSAELARPIDSPYAGPTFMAVELVPGAMNGITGRAEYPPPFNGL